MARQVGKTWWLRDVCDWRFEQGDRFGAEQLVLSTGKDLAVVREMQRPARVRAKAHGDVYKVREVNGQEEIEMIADGSRWMVRSKEGVYGFTASMATVDEAWKVSAAAVDDGLEPTMVEQPQSQLLLVSTAHRKATALMIGRRAGALDRLGDPDDGVGAADRVVGAPFRRPRRPGRRGSWRRRTGRRAVSSRSPNGCGRPVGRRVR